MEAAMWIGVLGPLDVRVGGVRVELSGRRTSIVLTSLAMSAGRAVGLRTLADHVWGERLPDSTTSSLHSLIMRLRKVTGPDVIRTVPSGYLLDIDPDQVDLLRFRRLVDEATRQADAEKARFLLGEALRLWRGEPLAGLVSEVLRRDVAPGLVEEQLVAIERQTGLDLAAGLNADLVSPLRELVGRHPLRETLWRLLITAQDAAGQRADALGSYQRLRVQLRERLGIEPTRELQDLYQRLLVSPTAAREPAASGQAPPSIRAHRNELPWDTADFVGRERELDQMPAAVPDGRGGAHAVTISAIDGMAGIGKTALAVHLAHRLAERYPDGQLFLDLHGHTPAHSPIEPATALDSLLRAIGVPGEKIPADPARRAALWRAELAGRRMLILLDNAASGAQVRPLIPGAPGCLAIVTSRRRIADLDGAQAFSLDLMPEADALALFAAIIGADRFAAEPAAVAEVLRLCGYLPLAIRISAARLRARPAWSVEHFATRLADQRRRLAELAVGERSVGAAFAISYEHLPAAHQRMFRLLGHYPGRFVDAYLAAAIADVEARDAEAILEDLVDVHLLRQPAPGRYQFHDLIRRYAHASADPAENAEAVHRMLDYYTGVIDLVRGNFAISSRAADFRPTRPPAHLPPIGDPSQALSWCDRESADLAVIITYAADNGWDEHVCRLSSGLWWYFRLRGHLHDWLAIQHLAVGAAERLGGRQVHADMERILGNVYAELEQYDETIRHHQAALALYREAGDFQGQTTTRSNLGEIQTRLGRHDEALRYLRRALTNSRDIGGDDYIEAAVLANLALTHQQTGRHQEAVDHGEQALACFRQKGDLLAQGLATSVLGLAYGRLGDAEKAIGYHREAVRLVRECGARVKEGGVLNDFGETLLTLGETDEAHRTYEQALAVALETNKRVPQARAHDGIARTLRDTDPAAAHEHWRLALAVYTELGLPEAHQIHAVLAEPATP